MMSKKVIRGHCQDLAAGRRADLTSLMVETVISIRAARLGDEAEIASVHDAAWREAYRGVIPGRELERMIARRGAAWWRLAIARRTPLLVLEFANPSSAMSVTGAIACRRSATAAKSSSYIWPRSAKAAGLGGVCSMRRGRIWRAMGCLP